MSAPFRDASSTSRHEGGRRKRETHDQRTGGLALRIRAHRRDGHRFPVFRQHARTCAGHLPLAILFVNVTVKASTPLIAMVPGFVLAGAALLPPRRY
jgi:hypothetical protein